MSVFTVERQFTITNERAKQVHDIAIASAHKKALNISPLFDKSQTFRVNSPRKWQCNISQHYSFSTLSPYQIQVKASARYTQFDLLCSLVQAQTCSRIYIDINLSDKQREKIRAMQQISGTEIINARLVHMFVQQSKLHA